MKQTNNNFKASFVGGIFFGTIMGLYTAIMSSSLIYSIGIGIFVGIFFGLAMAILTFFLNRSFKKKNLKVIGGEKIILDGPANHFMGKESVGGYLYLTKKEIIFNSHNLNIQVHETVIPIEQIFEVKTTLTCGLVPNGLQIITKNSVEKFVVANRKYWVQKINDAMLSQRKESEVGFN